MKTIKLTERQVIVLKSLLIQEIDYLENDAIPDALEQDKKDLQDDLEACKDLMEQLNK